MGTASTLQLHIVMCTPGAPASSHHQALMPECPSGSQLGCRVEQERVARELDGLQQRLEAKEASLAQLQSSSAVLALKANYDRVVSELATERDSLQKERMHLTQVL